MLNKYVILAAAVAMTYPVGRLARSMPTLRATLALLLGFLPFVGIDQLNVDLWGVPYYRGESLGFEITIVDLCVMALLVSLPEERQGPVPYRLPRYFYLAAVLFSIGAAAVPLYSWFSFWKLVRAYFLFAVVYRAVHLDARLGSNLADGFAVGILYSLVIGLYERYVEGYYQVTADFDHQNTLGMTVNLVFPVAWAVVLAGQSRVWGTLATAAAGVLVVMTLSRGSLALFGVAVLVVLVGSLVRGVTRWKVFVLCVMVLAGGIVLAKSSDSIIERFTEAPEGSELARQKFEGAAASMLEDYPLGVGVNQFSHQLDHGGYADEFGLIDQDRDAIVHHIYWLTLAEMGLVGLLALLVLCAAPWWTALRGAWRMRGDVRGDVLLGCLAGLSVTYLQGLYEWVARQTPMTYLYFGLLGLTAGLYRQWLDEQRIGAAIEEAARAAVERERPKDEARVELGIAS